MAKSIRNLFRQDRIRALRSKYGNSARWIKFTNKICADLRIKEYLNYRQEGFCLVCDRGFVFRDFRDTRVHHLSYDHECTLSERSNVFSPPPCGVCLRHHERDALACLSRVVLLHTDCHEQLHKAERRDPDWRVSVGLGLTDENR